MAGKLALFFAAWALIIVMFFTFIISPTVESATILVAAIFLFYLFKDKFNEG